MSAESTSTMTEESREGEAALRTVFDAMSELVLARDAAGRLTEVNQAFLDAFGGSRSDWIGCWFSVAPALDADGRVSRYDAAMRTRQGDAWIEWAETPLPQGGCVAVGRDVTAERASREDLSEASRGKGVFFAAVTHELRTPLSGTLGSAQLLADTPLQPDQASYVDAIRSSASHALALIDDILDLSRLEAGRLDLRPEAVDLRALVEDSCELLATRAVERGLSLAHAIDPSVPARVLADPARLRQVLFNLAGNAVKFTRHGGVLVTLEREAERFRLTVRDTGPGISQSDQERLFQNFERGAADRDGVAPGAGLGLAMVKRLGEIMGGEVGLHSRPGEGAVFWFSFPAGILDPAQPEARLSGQTLLIASPCPIQREALTRQATGLGATAHAVERAQDLSAAIASASGDLVLVLDEAWAAEAASLRHAGGRLRILALAQPRTKDLFSHARRPHGIDGWLVAPVRSRSLAAYADGRREPIEDSGWEPALTSADTPTAVPQEVLGGLRVLVAEDDPVNALIANRVLTRLGCDVISVTDGEQAIIAASDGGFDVVLLDMRMPGRTGPQAAIAIRSLEGPASTVPILALTANATEADRATCLAAGMDDFLTKPLDPAVLTTALGRLCQPENRSKLA